MVDHPRHILGIQTGSPIFEHKKRGDKVKDLCRTCFSAFRRWACRIKKSSPSSADKVEPPEAKFGGFSRSHKGSGAFNQSHKDISYGKEEELNMYNIHNIKCSYDGTGGNNHPIKEGLYRHKSIDALSPHVSSPLSRCESRKSKSSRRSYDSTNAFPPSLSRSSSRMVPTPIMFSNSTGQKVKPPAIQKDLECTLEELCYGCMKKVKVTRDILTETGQIIQEEEILSIKVKPGWTTGTRITFEGRENEKPGTSAADVTLTIVEKRHHLFRRDGDDLEIGVEIPLVKALTGCKISIPLLGGQKMSLTINDIIYHGYQEIIAGEGMPITKELGRRGDLKAVFLVEFPSKLTNEQRSDIISILEDSVFC